MKQLTTALTVLAISFATIQCAHSIDSVSSLQSPMRHPNALFTIVYAEHAPPPVVIKVGQQVSIRADDGHTIRLDNPEDLIKAGSFGSALLFYPYQAGAFIVHFTVVDRDSGSEVMTGVLEFEVTR